MKRIAAIVLALLLGARALYAQEPGTGGVSLEYQVKGAFLCNFLKFIEWPENKSPQYHICLVGTDPFGKVLDEIATQSQNDKPVIIDRLKKENLTPSGVKACDLIFVPENANSLVEPTAQAASKQSIVTVAEDNTAAMISFTLVNGKVRFKIQQDKLAGSGVKASSKLLKLAVNE